MASLRCCESGVVCVSGTTLAVITLRYDKVITFLYTIHLCDISMEKIFEFGNVIYMSIKLRKFGKLIMILDRMFYR